MKLRHWLRIISKTNIYQMKQFSRVFTGAQRLLLRVRSIFRQNYGKCLRQRQTPGNEELLSSELVVLTTAQHFETRQSYVKDREKEKAREGENEMQCEGSPKQRTENTRFSLERASQMRSCERNSPICWQRKIPRWILRVKGDSRCRLRQ